MKSINAYLVFNGNCREAMAFYAKCFGGKLKIMTFDEAKVPAKKGFGKRVMHARIDKGPAVLMASDNMPGDKFQIGNNLSISVNCQSVSEIEKLFAGFSSKAKITMPLGKTFWADRFGMLTDKFGVHWMFNLDKKP